MKLITGNPNRDEISKTIFSSGSFKYSLEPNYGSLPSNFEFTMFSSGCCDKFDNLFLATRSTEHPIVILDNEGNYIKSIGKGLFKDLHDIFVTENDTLLCVDRDLHVVREISKSGEHIMDLGNLNTPSDSGFDPDAWRKLQKSALNIPTDIAFNNAWAFSEGLKTIKRSAPPFNRPTGIATNSEGDIFVSDGYGNASIHKFSSDGKLLKTWGGVGDNPGQFKIPHSIWIDIMDRVWVADREGNCVHIFDKKGYLIAYISENLYQPTALWSDKNYMYIGERGGGITVVNMNLDIVAQLGFYNSSIRSHGMCGNSKGDLFLMPLSTFDYHYLMKLKKIK